MSSTIERPRAESPSARGDTWFRGDVDGLRAIAIVLVVAFHAGVGRVHGGFTGVDVFFVISGFLITRNLLRETAGSGRVTLAKFWGRRIRRLVPALALVIVATLVAARVVMSRTSQRDTANHAVAAALYFSNMRFASQSTDYFAANVNASPFLHTWSLGVEEQFYLMWPILIAATCWLVHRLVRSGSATSRRRALVALFGAVFVISMGINVVLSDRRSSYDFYSLPSRAWEFAAAGLLAALPLPSFLRGVRTRTAVAGAGLVLILGGGLLIVNSAAYPGLAAIVPVVGTLLAIAAGDTWQGSVEPAPLSRLLAARPMQWLGRVSYSWYLWHWPAMVLTVAATGHDSTMLRLLVAVATLPVAWAAYRYFETPLRFAPLIARSSTRTFAAGALVTLVVVALSVAVRPPLPVSQRLARDLGATIEQLQAPPGSSLETRVDYAVSLYRERVKATCPIGGTAIKAGDLYCTGGDLSGTKSVLLLGDSHAGQWRRAFDQLGKAKGFKLYVREHDGCTPFDVLHSATDATGTRNARIVCDRQLAGDLRVVKALKPTVVVMAAWAGSRYAMVDHHGKPITDIAEQQRVWATALDARITDLRATGSKVGLIVDEPTLPVSASQCLTKKGRIDACTFPLGKLREIAAPLIYGERLVAAYRKVPIFDMEPTICPDGICRTEVGGVLVYVDSHHLTDAFALSQKPAIGRFVEPLLR